MVPGAPAIANAIYNATGCRFTEMPITPERMQKAQQEKAAEARAIGTKNAGTCPLGWVPVSMSLWCINIILTA